jgi:hypothetical protein
MIRMSRIAALVVALAYPAAARADYPVTGGKLYSAEDLAKDCRSSNAAALTACKRYIKGYLDGVWMSNAGMNREPCYTLKDKEQFETTLFASIVTNAEWLGKEDGLLGIPNGAAKAIDLALSPIRCAPK